MKQSATVKKRVREMAARYTVEYCERRLRENPDAVNALLEDVARGLREAGATDGQKRRLRENWKVCY